MRYLRIKDAHKQLARTSLKVKILEAKYEAKLEFPRERAEYKKNSMEGQKIIIIFWNCTLHVSNTIRIKQVI